MRLFDNVIKPTVLSRTEICFLFASVIIAFYLRELVHVRLFPDSAQYLTFARNILSGIHNTGGEISSLAKYRRPPLYPHLIALFSLGNTLPLFLSEIGRQISVFSGAILVVPLYFLGRMIRGKATGVILVLFVLINPDFLYYSGTVLTESLATLILTLSMILLVMITRKGGNKPLCFFLGVFLGLAFLAKHSLIGYLPIFIFYFVIAHFFTRNRPSFSKLIAGIIIPVLLIVVGFFFAISPQSIYLHSETGKWAFAIDPNAMNLESLNRQGEDIRYTENYEALESLTSDGESLLNEASGASGLFSIIKDYPVEYIKAYLTTVSRGYLPDTYPLPYPGILLFLVLIGIIGLIGERKYSDLIFCLCGFAGFYLFLCLFLNIRDRHMFPAYPFLLLMAAIGVDMVASFFKSLLQKISQTARLADTIRPLVYGLICIFLLLPGGEIIKAHSSEVNINFSSAIGMAISEKIEKNALVFDRSPLIPYLAGAIFVGVPYADPQEVIKYAQKKGIDYWIVDTSYVPRLRPQFEELLSGDNNYKGIKPILFLQLPKAKFRLIVYKFLPPS